MRSRTIGVAPWLLGAVWVAVVVASVIGDEPTDRSPLGWVVVGVGLLLAWAAVGMLALALARVVESVWLGSWGLAGRPLVRRRQSRWLRAQALAVAPGPAAQIHAIRRTTISLAPPQRPLWIGDRWASMVARVGNEYAVDVAMTWPRLWLVLAEPVRAELRTAAAAWYGATTWAAWGVLFLAAGFLSWPAAIAAVVLLVWGWARGRIAVAFWADLVEAAYDLFGPDLGEALGVPTQPLRPLRPDAGAAITRVARKGS